MVLQYKTQSPRKAVHPNGKGNAEETPLTSLYLLAFDNMLGHRHFNFQVTVILGPGVILSHSSVVAVGVCLELLLSPVGGERRDRLNVRKIRAWRQQEA